ESLAHQIRRGVVWAIILSFGIAALGGVAVLLSGAWTDLTAKVLATTALTGLFSVGVLCGAALFEKAGQWFGWVTVVISLGTLIQILAQLWTDFPSLDRIYEWAITLCILTAACAVASLLLLLA